MIDNDNNENLEIIRDFVAEACDILDALEPSLMQLEKTISSGTIERDLFHEIFRAFHSIKGAAGFLEFESISKLTHQAESLLDLFRKGKAEIEQRHIDLFYQATDMLVKLIGLVDNQLTDTGMEVEVGQLAGLMIASFPSESDSDADEPTTGPAEDAPGSLAGVVNRLASINSLLWGIERVEHEGRRKDTLAEARTRLLVVRNELDQNGLPEPLEVAEKLIEQLDIITTKGGIDRNLIGIFQHVVDGLGRMLEAHQAGKPSDQGFLLAAVLEELAEITGDEGLPGESEMLLGRTLVNLGVITGDNLEAALAVQEKPLGEILLEMKALDQDQLALGLKIQNQRKKAVKAQPKSGDLGQTIRVDINKLELMGNLVGELVIAENMVTHHESVAGEEFESFHKAAQVLNRISREIQDLVMSLRMVPVMGTFQKLTRVIRDVSQKLEKKVEVEQRGQNTEIDKNVIENLSSPLVHIVRNAVDHGLETIEERLAAGKPETGHVILDASQEGGEILIRVTDDGKGIDKERVLQKATEKGLISPGQVFNNDEDIFDLIFQPGFSTAAQVTEVSGRGVGMDVVRKNIQDLQGSIGISSKPGKGSTFTLRIPLTLSIIEGMLVRVGNAVLTVPLLSIRESFVVKDHVITTNLDGEETILIRDSLLPIVRLSEFFGWRAEHTELKDGILIIVEYGRQARCIFVDEIIGQRQAVIKKVSNFFGDLRGVSGFSILSNGDIALVMDVTQLVRFT
ncbi:MAG: chemotaxis protein CheA [Acidobacteriota bacterium]|nr:chemotaxis protein CheA [Acidobacteriota bacterium]